MSKFRWLAAISAASSVLALVVLDPSSADAATKHATSEPGHVTVCASGCDYTTIAPALDAVATGGTVTVGPGTYKGGLTITRSVTLVGAGTRSTTINGGGPVIEIDTANPIKPPTVAISGVTITGGVTTQSFGQPFVAFGGGIAILPAPNPNGPGQTGATVTLSDIAVVGNRAEPKTSIDSGQPCPKADCQFGLAGGGGIADFGNLTLDHSTVSDNMVAGPHTSDAYGAGIYTSQGALRIIDSTVSANRATAHGPVGRFAEGAGIYAVDQDPTDDIHLSIDVAGSTLDGNVASLRTTLGLNPDGTSDLAANTGGLHVGDGSPVTVTDSTLSHNRVVGNDPYAFPGSIDAAMSVGDSPLTMRNTLMSGNVTSSVTRTTASTGSNGSTFEVDGPARISGLRLVRNSSVVTSAHGVAGVTGALSVFNFNGDPRPVVVTDSTIARNTALSRTTSGTAVAEGAGVFNNSLLQFRHVAVTGNVATAIGPRGHAQGGGIWNGVEISGPPVRLALTDGRVTGNSARGSTSAIHRQGGGIYSSAPLSVTRVLIRANNPDQCVGCAAG